MSTESREPMYNECRHIMPSGARCHSPAMREMPYCYFHSRLRKATEPKSKFDDLNLKLPPLEDLRSVQIALTQILSALCTSQLDPRHARLLLRGLEIATRVATRLEDRNSADSTQSLCNDIEDDGLAPEQAICEPPADCGACTARENCHSYSELVYRICEKRLKERQDAARNQTAPSDLAQAAQALLQAPIAPS